MGQNICEGFIWQGVIYKILRISNNSIEETTKLTSGQIMNRYLCKEHTNGQQVFEKVLNSTNHHGNADQIHNEMLSHIC